MLKVNNSLTFTTMTQTRCLKILPLCYEIEGNYFKILVFHFRYFYVFGRSHFLLPPEALRLWIEGYMHCPNRFVLFSWRIYNTQEFHAVCFHNCFNIVFKDRLLFHLSEWFIRHDLPLDNVFTLHYYKCFIKWPVANGMSVAAKYNTACNTSIVSE